MFYDDEVVYLLNFIFLKICFILKINYVYACMSVHGCVHINSSAFRGQKKKAIGPLELDSQVIVRYLTWIQGDKFRSSGGESTRNH